MRATALSVAAVLSAATAGSDRIAFAQCLLNPAAADLAEMPVDGDRWGIGSDPPFAFDPDASAPGGGFEPTAGNGAEEPSDLTLGSFFSDGWTSDWVKRSRRGRAPDMALLRVTTNFLEREFRLDYAYTNQVKNSAKVDHSQLLNGLIAYGLNRRLMIEVISNYQWNEPPSGSTATKQNGSGAAALARFQLADTYDSAYAFQVKAAAPNRGIGQTQTTVSPSLAGFQDLQVLAGLERVGLYESVTYDSLTGPHATGVRTRSVSYDVSLARTWTDPEAHPFGNFTTFLETFATTDLDGPTDGRTSVSMTPGVRFWFARENSLTLGVDLPVSHPHTYGEIYRVTYILTF